MNHHADKESLLAEVLAEASPADFRAALLAETLRRARRRRHFRLARRAAGVVMAIGVLTLLAIRPVSRPSAVSPVLTQKVVAQSYELVHTQPLPAGLWIRTRSFSEIQTVAPVSVVAEIATVSGGYRLINDDELLALLADKPAVLIRTGPHSEELVFANPEDQKKFLVY